MSGRRKTGMWRKRAMAVIDQARSEYPSASGDELREILKERYPFGPRKYYPYQVWLDCVNEVCKVKADKQGRIVF